VDSCSVLSIALCDRMSLTFEDVLSFPQEARVCFSSQPERYLQFFDAVSKYAAEEYDSFICYRSHWSKGCFAPSDRGQTF